MNSSCWQASFVWISLLAYYKFVVDLWNLKSRNTIIGMDIRCASGGRFFILNKHFVEWFRVEEWVWVAVFSLCWMI
jgi:hypothetical protein